MKKGKRILCGILAAICFTVSVPVAAADEVTQYWPEGPQVGSQAAIVVEANTGTLLYEKNINDQHFPASITKILTTLLVIENSTMDEVVTFSHDSIYNTEGSGIARDVDEQMTMEQCLYAIMLESANECAYAVAEHVAGSVDNFVNLMNDRAAKIGCQNTHFVNCNGLPHDDHYTSAYDMALIAREAYNNETFRIICGTKTYTIPVTNKHPTEETHLRNHHEMLYPLKTRNYLYDYCTGGKTGYTMAANSTLVTFAEKDGMTLICVVLNADSPSHYLDTRALMDFCFDNFKIFNVAENETEYTQDETKETGELNSKEPFVSLDPKGAVILPVTAEFKDVEKEITFDTANESRVGTLNYNYSGRKVGGADIITTNARVDEFNFNNKKTETKQQEETTEALDKGGNKEEKVFQINLRIILYVVLGIGVLLILILLIKKFADNIYHVFYKFNIKKRDKPRYKVIKKNKSYRSRKRTKR